jgi:tRNA(fMet)-specific endonuclease VapC
MTAFDTDILSLILAGHPGHYARMLTVNPADRCVPVVASAEHLRGWLSAIRSAEAGRGRISLALAYDMYDNGLRGLVAYRTLHYTAAADAEYRRLRATRIRIGSNDLRIAAICLAHNAKLVTRNARDYTQVPGLNLEVWN